MKHIIDINSIRTVELPSVTNHYTEVENIENRYKYTTVVVKVPLPATVEEASNLLGLSDINRTPTLVAFTPAIEGVSQMWAGRIGTSVVGGVCIEDMGVELQFISELTAVKENDDDDN